MNNLQAIKRKPLLLTGCLATLIFVSLVFLHANFAGAEGLRISPLEYKTDLNGKIEKGAVDITNTSGTTQQISIQVQAFKQINNKGSLEFYNDAFITAGVIPDYNTFELKPLATMHMYFLLDGQKLPKKQIFAGILAQANPLKSSYNITPVIRVGTLLILKNGDGDPPKQGEISKLSLPYFLFGNTIRGNFLFKNSETGENASGYFPNFTISVGNSSQNFTGSLLFPSIERMQSFALRTGNQFGIYHLNIKSDAGVATTRKIILITGFYRWLVPLIIVLLVLVIISVIKIVKAKYNHKIHVRQQK